MLQTHQKRVRCYHCRGVRNGRRGATTVAIRCYHCRAPSEAGQGTYLEYPLRGYKATCEAARADARGEGDWTLLSYRAILPHVATTTLQVLPLGRCYHWAGVTTGRVLPLDSMGRVLPLVGGCYHRRGDATTGRVLPLARKVLPLAERAAPFAGALSRHV